MAWQLAETGYNVELDVRDWAAAQDFITKISDALDHCDRAVDLRALREDQTARELDEDMARHRRPRQDGDADG